MIKWTFSPLGVSGDTAYESVTTIIVVAETFEEARRKAMGVQGLLPTWRYQGLRLITIETQ